MNALERRKIWQNKKTDSAGNTLVVTKRVFQELAPGGSSDLHCGIVIESAATDEYGRSLRRSVGFPVDDRFISELTNAVRALRDANEAPQNRNEALVQIRYGGRGSSGLVVMMEIPPYDAPEKRTPRFVIGNGSTIGFVIPTHPELAELLHELQTALTS